MSEKILNGVQKASNRALRGGGFNGQQPQSFGLYQRWDISIVKNCRILALENFLFDFKRTFGSKVMVS